MSHVYDRPCTCGISGRPVWCCVWYACRAYPPGVWCRVKSIEKEVYDALQHDPFYGPAAQLMVEYGYWTIVQGVEKNEV